MDDFLNKQISNLLRHRFISAYEVRNVVNSDNGLAHSVLRFFMDGAALFVTAFISTPKGAARNHNRKDEP